MSKKLYSIAVAITGSTSVVVEADSIEEARQIYEDRLEGSSFSVCNQCCDLAYNLALGELDADNADDQIEAVNMECPREVENAKRRRLLWR